MKRCIRAQNPDTPKEQSGLKAADLALPHLVRLPPIFVWNKKVKVIIFQGIPSQFRKVFSLALAPPATGRNKEDSSAARKEHGCRLQ
jgi:hypothetical protein